MFTVLWPHILNWTVLPKDTYKMTMGGQPKLLLCPLRDVKVQFGRAKTKEATAKYSTIEWIPRLTPHSPPGLFRFPSFPLKPNFSFCTAVGSGMGWGPGISGRGLMRVWNDKGGMRENEVSKLGKENPPLGITGQSPSWAKLAPWPPTGLCHICWRGNSSNNILSLGERSRLWKWRRRAGQMGGRTTCLL